MKVKVLLMLLLFWATADQSLITLNRAHSADGPVGKAAGDQLDWLDLACDMPEANASAEE